MLAFVGFPHFMMSDSSKQTAPDIAWGGGGLGTRVEMNGSNLTPSLQACLASVQTPTCTSGLYLTLPRSAVKLNQGAVCSQQDGLGKEVPQALKQARDRLIREISGCQTPGSWYRRQHAYTISGHILLAP